MINHNPTKPCATCDDVYVWFAGEWSHAGTAYSDKCPAIYPDITYINPEQRRKIII